MKQRENSHILVAEVEDELFGGGILPSGSRRLWQRNVELQGGVGGEVGQVGRSPDLNARSPVELHRDAHLDGQQNVTGRNSWTHLSLCSV